MDQKRTKALELAKSQIEKQYRGEELFIQGIHGRNFPHYKRAIFRSRHFRIVPSFHYLIQYRRPC